MNIYGSDNKLNMKTDHKTGSEKIDIFYPIFTYEYQNYSTFIRLKH